MRIRFEVLDKIKEIKPKCLLIVTNQGGIESGFVYAHNFRAKSEYITRAIHEYCDCECYTMYCETNDKTDPYRKPNTGMLDDLLENYVGDDFEYIKQISLMIGDANGTFKIEAPIDVYWTSNFIIPASEEAKKELFDKMKEAGYKWNADTLDLEKIPKFKNKFKPFDKVLVRNDTDEEWTINLFSYYNEKDKAFPFICINDFYRYCIPYEGNEHLVGKTN